MPDVFKIADILVSHAVRAHKDEVALIVYGGSYAKGTASPSSDLDIYYIPDEGKAESLSSQFILDGLPYDFWGVPWKFAEDIANARSRRPWAVSASLIADTKVLYHRSQADLERFKALKARIAELTRPESRRFMVERALDEFKYTLFQLGQLRLAAGDGDAAGVRWASWEFVCRAVNCLALVNQTYFSKGWGANWSQILALPQRPVGLEEMMRNIITPRDTESTFKAADRLAREVRGILLAAQASLAEPLEASEVFKDFYYFIFEYQNKVLAACERGDVTVGFAAFHMQEVICQLMNKVENGFYGTDFNLLGEYMGGYTRAGFPDLSAPASRGDLDELARRVQQLDERAREWFGSHAIDLGLLDSEQALRQFLERPCVMESSTC
jgi:hypothetical protein